LVSAMRKNCRPMRPNPYRAMFFIVVNNKMEVPEHQKEASK
jgi:hypothetical protein